MHIRFIFQLSTNEIGTEAGHLGSWTCSALHHNHGWSSIASFPCTISITLESLNVQKSIDKCFEWAQQPSQRILWKREFQGSPFPKLKCYLPMHSISFRLNLGPIFPELSARGNIFAESNLSSPFRILYISISSKLQITIPSTQPLLVQQTYHLWNKTSESLQHFLCGKYILS